MKPFVTKHFLSLQDNSRFVVFLVAVSFLLVVASVNKDRSFQVLPMQNQMMDTKPRQSDVPGIHKPMAERGNFRKA
jgi:hypothetical protein